MIHHECLTCGHPTEHHDHIGCTWMDHQHICTCPVTGRQLDDDLDDIDVPCTCELNETPETTP